MDKLQPIIRHKFWIIFVLAMLLPTVGWWLDTSSMNAEIEAATAAAEGAFNSVPPANSPNETFADKVKVVNEQLAAANIQHNIYLWEAQQDVMDWPASIDKEMLEVSYKGEIPIELRRLYRKDYFVQLERMPEYADALSIENPNGTVVFNIANFMPQIERQTWGISPPVSETMWEVQEDLWLLRSLLSAIGRTNAGYDSILQSPIKEVTAILLRGGDPNAPKGGAALGADGAMAAPDAAAGAVPGAPGGMVRSEFDQAPQGVDFDPTDVFGPDTLQGAGGVGPDGAPAAPIDPAAGAFAAGGPGGGAQAKVRRYVDDEEGAPFKTRGFYMHLVMDHSKLSDLMVQLSALDFPVEILRVQQQVTNPDSFTSVGNRGMGIGGRGGDAAGPTGGGIPGIFNRRSSRGSIPGMRNGGGLGGRRFGGGLGGSPFGGGIGPDIDAGGPMGPIGNGRRTPEQEEQERLQELKRMYQAALQKTNLVDVAIAGKFTLFQPPPADAVVAEAGAAGQPATPAANGTTTDPMATDPAATDAAATGAAAGVAPAADGATQPAQPAAGATPPAATDVPAESTPPATAPATAPADGAAAGPANPTQTPPAAGTPAAAGDDSTSESPPAGGTPPQ